MGGTQPPGGYTYRGLGPSGRPLRPTAHVGRRPPTPPPPRSPMAAHFRGHRRNAPRATECGGSWAAVIVIGMLVLAGGIAAFAAHRLSRVRSIIESATDQTSGAISPPTSTPSSRNSPSTRLRRLRTSTPSTHCPAAGWQAQRLRYQRESNDRLQRQHRQRQRCFQHGRDHRTLRKHQRVWRPERDHRRCRRCYRRLRLQQQGHLSLGHAEDQQCRRIERRPTGLTV